MLTAQQAAIAKGMLARGDKQHDIAAYFGENSGRIAEISTGRLFNDVMAASIGGLPPAGAARRFIDPNSPVEKQWAQLQDLIRNPPENSRVVTFTPALAAMILSELNQQNRKKRPSKIRRFAEFMEADRWLLTGDTIKFGRSGVLRDGQNRLSACVRSAVNFRTHIVFGIDDKAFAVIDTNAVRTSPDTLHIAGVPYSREVAQAVRWIIIYESAPPLDRGKSVDNDQLLSYYTKKIDKNRMDRSIARALAAGRPLSAGSLAAHLYLFEAIHAKATERFSDDLAQQARGGRKLVEKLQRLRKQSMGRLNEMQVNALTIQAWKSYRKGEPLTMAMLNWNENKDFPSFE